MSPRKSNPWPSTPQEARRALEKTDPDLLELWLGLASDLSNHPPLHSYDDMARWVGELRKGLRFLPNAPAEVAAAWKGQFPELDVISKALATLREACGSLDEKIERRHLLASVPWKEAKTLSRRAPPATQLAIVLVVASRALGLREPSARELASIAIVSGLDEGVVAEDTWDKRLAAARRSIDPQLMGLFGGLLKVVTSILESRSKKSTDVPVTPSTDPSKLLSDAQTDPHPLGAPCLETKEPKSEKESSGK